jgi:hypothetical protein
VAVDDAREQDEADDGDGGDAQRSQHVGAPHRSSVAIAAVIAAIIGAVVWSRHRRTLASACNRIALRCAP